MFREEGGVDSVGVLRCLCGLAGLGLSGWGGRGAAGAELPQGLAQPG